MGSGLAQDIPEQKRGQLLGRYGGQLHFGGNGDGLSGSGRVHGGLGGCGVKLRPCLLRKNGVGLGVIGGVFHLSGDLFMNFLGGLGLGRKDGSLDIYLGMTFPSGLRWLHFPKRRRKPFKPFWASVISRLSSVTS